MSNRLDLTFQQLRQSGRKALVGYLTAGDPNFETSLALLRAACEAGVDVLELGVPFSDPTSDGPVIQAASLRALKAGMTVENALRLTRELRRQTQTPIILFSYYNPLLSHGLERLARDARDAGADGFLVVDLPPEESEEFTAVVGADLPLIRLIAPTTPPERVPVIVQNASGFLYAITRTGVTGMGGLEPEAIRREMGAIRQAARGLPVCLGFGIRTPADARALAPMADGLVVGSALVQLAEKSGGKPDLIPRVCAFIRELKKAMNEG
ncbi:MAG: tryptophan synthase subunit alpha [Kiritimatiellia bacterium]